MPTFVSIRNLKTLSRLERLELTRRTESDMGSFLERVGPIIEDVRERGDEALVEYARKFDKAIIRETDIQVSPEEYAEARDQVSDELMETLELAHENVRTFHELQMPDRLSLHEPSPGVMVGDRWTPIDSVACYVPRGKGSFPSSVLMTSVPAKVAGVPKVIVVTPPGPDGKADPGTLVAARIAGVDDVYKCGGAQGVAAVAFGTDIVPKCLKIVGPGSPWVVAAKKYLASEIDPGSPAGPSELIVVADDTVSPELAALDLCVESEHGPDSSVFLVTTDPAFAERVAKAIPDVWAKLPEVRAGFSRTVLGGEKGGILIAADVDDAFDFINEYAAEHLAILSRDAWSYLARVRNAGEVLLGPSSAVAIANFVLGPSHVLPTGGAARTASPLAVFDFLKRTSVASVSESAYASLAGHAERLALYEGFAGHAHSVSDARFDLIR